MRRLEYHRKRKENKPTQRYKILCHCNIANWCHQKTAESVIARLSDEFDFEIVIGKRVKPKTCDLLWSRASIVMSDGDDNSLSWVKEHTNFIMALPTSGEPLKKLFEANKITGQKPLGIMVQNREAFKLAEDF